MFFLGQAVEYVIATGKILQLDGRHVLQEAANSKQSFEVWRAGTPSLPIMHSPYITAETTCKYSYLCTVRSEIFCYRLKLVHML